MCLRTRHAKCQEPSARGTFSNLGLNGGWWEKCAFSMENWPYLGNGER